MIDLGTLPLGRTLPSAELDADRMDYLVDTLGIADLPVVLDVFPRFDGHAERQAALRRGQDELVADGLLPDGRVHPDLELWLQVLERPRWQIAARIVPRPFGPNSPIRRVCLASGERGSVLAVGTGDVLVLGFVDGDPSRALLDTLGSGSAFDFRGLSAPTDLLADALDAAPTDPRATAVQLTRIGIEESAAVDLASAMSTVSSHAEITCAVYDSGIRTVDQHPVAVFDTHRGRVVATSSTATDGRRWTSCAPASTARVRSALSEMIARATT